MSLVHWHQKHSFIQKYGPESCEAINRLASFTDADRLTDRQLKLSDPGMHPMYVSSSSHKSVRAVEAPGPIKFAMELTKLLNSRSGTERSLGSIAAPFSIDPSRGISRSSGLALLDSGGWGSRTGASIQILNPYSEPAP